jgi:hypothetical protein
MSREFTPRLSVRQVVVGSRFGRWTVVSAPDAAPANKRRCECRCDCGTIRAVLCVGLVSRNSQSCGCLKNQIVRANQTKHGLYRAREYRTWVGMKARCLNPKHTSYDRYGGRGITVCERWASSFENFIQDMGVAPSDKHELDRKNNDGHYTPENCRWATETEQARNTSFNVRYTHDGQTKPLSEWLELYGIDRGTVKHRLRNGMSFSEAISNPVRSRHGSDGTGAKLDDEKVLEIRRVHAAEKLTFAELGRRYGVSYHAIAKIIKRRSWAHI